MKHVMIDIEALDKKPTAAIVSLAAAVFDPMTGRVDASMYRTVNIESSEAAGGTIGADTVKWWFKKSREVQAAVLSEQAVQLGVALADLNLFVLAYCDADSVKVWARGTDYDMPIISHAMQSLGIRPVWNFWNVRDVRTVEEISLMVCGYASRRDGELTLSSADPSVSSFIDDMRQRLTTALQRPAVPSSPYGV